MTREEKKKVNAYIQMIEDNPRIFDKEELAFENAWKWNEYFWNENEIILEIGTWLGNYFSMQASQNPNKNYIWKEIRFKRLHVTSEKSIQAGADNFALICTKWENISKSFGDGELSETYVFFPDPWANKDRQRKHRIFQDEFIENLYKKTKTWGKLFFKTDHREYFESTLELFSKHTGWKLINKSFDYENELEIFDTKKMTEFEEIFREERLNICYVEFEKI